MTDEEFDAWQRYARETPIDPESLYLRPVAMLAALTANLNRDPKISPEPYTARDFMQTYELLPFETIAPDLTDSYRDFAERHNASLRGKAEQ